MLKSGSGSACARTEFTLWENAPCMNEIRKIEGCDLDRPLNPGAANRKAIAILGDKNWPKQVDSIFLVTFCNMRTSDWPSKIVPIGTKLCPLEAAWWMNGPGTTTTK